LSGAESFDLNRFRLVSHMTPIKSGLLI